MDTSTSTRSGRRSGSRLAVLLAVLAVMIAVTVTSNRSGSYAITAPYPHDAAVDAEAGRATSRTITVEIAENAKRAVIDEAPVFDDGLPAHGAAFVTHGYLYPRGTLNGTDGVKPDGSPQYPRKVIGEWWCLGYLINEAAHATEGAWVYSTQLFSFGPTPDEGRRTLVVTGYEGAGIGQPVLGAITGGTGKHAAARGEAKQTLLGFNPTEGVDKRVTFRLAN